MTNKRKNGKDTLRLVTNKGKNRKDALEVVTNKGKNRKDTFKLVTNKRREVMLRREMVEGNIDNKIKMNDREKKPSPGCFCDSSRGKSFRKMGGSCQLAWQLLTLFRLAERKLIKRSCATLAKVYALGMKLNTEISSMSWIAVQVALEIRLEQMKRELEVAKQNNSNLISFWERHIANLEAGKRAIDTANQ